MQCLDFGFGLVRAPGSVVNGDKAFDLALVDIVNPFCILVLLGMLCYDANCIDGLALVLRELELFANRIAQTLGIGELVDANLVLDSIDTANGKDGSGNELEASVSTSNPLEWVSGNEI